MPRSNPVRKQYAFIGTLQCVGIFNYQGATFIAPELGMSGIPASMGVPVPEDVLWLTQRSINHAQYIAQAEAQRQGRSYEVDLVHPIISIELLEALKKDPKAIRRRTEDMIVHMCGGESSENRAYAKDQIARMNEYYLGSAKKTAAA
jgi:hypothetical protein